MDNDSNVVVVNGHRHLVVALELLMACFSLLYAFPLVPTKLFQPDNDEAEGSEWVSISAHRSMCDALLVLLNNSPIVQLCLRETGTERLTLEAL